MKLLKEIKNLRGQTFRQAIFIKEDLDKIPKDKNGQPDFSTVGNENIENVILNCLSLYQVKTTKESFYLNAIANIILTREKDEIELQSKFRKFLIEVLESSIMKTEITENEGKKVESRKGIYSGWIISQVLAELGVKISDEGEIVY